MQLLWRCLLLVFSTLFHRVLSNPLGPLRSSIDGLSLNPLHSSTPTAPVSLIPTPKTITTSLTANPWFPHRYRVPTTKTVLRLNYGLIRHRIDLLDLQSLIHLAKGTIEINFDAHGGNTVYPLDAHGRQIFAQLGFGIQLRIENVAPQPLFTYRMLYEVVEGLRLFLVVGKRNCEVWFKVWNGLGEWPDRGDPVAKGAVERVGKRGMEAD